jgi:PRC-barrel domain protein
MEAAMLWRCSELGGYAIAARDGEIGHVDDLLFEEARWTVRWLVVETGGWLSGRRVLLAPPVLGHPDRGARRFPVNLTRAQVEQSPPLESDLPVSRQVEANVLAHYGLPPYWEGDLMPPLNYLSEGAAHAMGFLFPPEPMAAEAEAAGDKPGTAAAMQGDPQLRSTSQTVGHVLRARDGEIGHVEDFLVDEEGWRIRYMVVDTGRWLSGRKVLIAPQWIRDFDWAERRVDVDLTRAQVRASPPYDPAKPVERPYEAELHGHYGRAGYWPMG